MPAFENTAEFAEKTDRTDPLRSFRNEYVFPRFEGKDVLYFTGNSLGLQPKKSQQYLNEEMEDWGKFGVEGHFMARRPWFSYHELLTEKIAAVVGAKPVEVVAMNQLTVNLHLLMVSFYRPTRGRYKVLCEKKAFPSDQYALETQAKFHGFDPDDAIIEVSPRENEETLRHEDIIDAIKKHGSELALVFFGGVNYFTGQVFRMKEITEAAHLVGAVAGFDLAHAAGNIDLRLHDWDVDFASWCSYKYLNSGPGGVSGVFVHERHSRRKDLQRFGGWWGHDKSTRFLMEKGFNPMEGAEGWQLSNAPVLSMAVHLAALELFQKATMVELIKKSSVLTAYLEFIINDVNRQRNFAENEKLKIITPADRGCQLSIVAQGQGKDLFYKFQENGVIVDWREPDVIRVAPVPMYNSFSDVFNFGKILQQLL